MKGFFTKEVNIFGNQFILVALLMIIWCSIFATQALINIILVFSTGPFYIMCIWIFIFTVHITVGTYNIFWNKMKVDKT